MSANIIVDSSGLTPNTFSVVCNLMNTAPDIKDAIWLKPSKYIV